MTNFVLRPWLLLLIGIAGGINRRQQEAIEYLRTENRVLRDLIGKKRIPLNDDQRRRLAVKGKVLGISHLRELASLFTPETILRWHRQLIARKWDFSHKRSRSAGRPAIEREVVDLVLLIWKDQSSVDWNFFVLLFGFFYVMARPSR